MGDEVGLQPETLTDLARTRVELEKQGDRLHQEYRRHEAAAESARYDRDLLDKRVDAITAVIGDRERPNWMYRLQRSGDPDADLLPAQPGPA